MRVLTAMGLLALLCLAPLTVAPAQGQTTVRPAISVPPIANVARTLANGARVYAIRDASASSVSVNVWYNVGQRDDPRGRGGFAHLFEHLMFKTTRNLPDGVAAFVTSLGAQTNASTLFDHTSYYITAPADRLEALLWLEGERLRNLVIDEASFRSERDVVKEELRQRVFAQPYGRILYTLLPAFTFSAHPYARPIGGTIADLDQAVLADVRAFHETYYRPDNAVFVVSGNFDPARLDAWVDLYLGSIPRPATTMPRDPTTESAPLAARTVDAFAPNVPLPALVLSWRAPPAGDPDSAGLALAEALLARGSGARLRRRLVDELQLASSISSFNIPARDGHAFALVVTLAPGRDLAAAEAAVSAELARLRAVPADAAELAAARNGLLGDALLNRETPRGRAFELGDGVVLSGDPRAADRRLQAISAATPADVQRVATRWLRDDRRLTLRYQDEAARPAGYAGDRPADISAMGTIVPPAARPPVAIAAPAERQAPPGPGPTIRRAVPVLAERTLPNGLRIVSSRSTALPLVTLKLVVPGGDAADPEGKSGLADMMAALALRGGGGRDAAAVAREAAALGGSIGAAADADAITFSLTVPAANAEAGGRLLADLVLRPTFAEAELDRVRRQQTDALTVAGRQPMQAALRILPAAVLRGSAYGRVPTAASLAAISRADILAAAGRWSPHGATLVATGALTPVQADALAGRLFGGWPAGGSAVPTPPAMPAPAAPQVLVVDIPNAGQAAVLAAVPAIGRGDPAWPALRVANARLGTGFQGFLSQEIRVRRGLSYGAGSLFDTRRGATLVIAATQTRNEAADEVVGLVLDQFSRLSREPISAADAAERSAVVNVGVAVQTERTSGLADYLVSVIATGTPLAVARAELAGTPPPVPEAVTAVSANYLVPGRATIVVAGDSRRWLDALRRRFPALVVVDADGRPVS